MSTTSDLVLTWDTSCLTTENVDIYLFAYQTSSSGSAGQTGMIHAWTAAPWSKGSFDVGKLNPSWWNNTAQASLQVAIVEANTPRFFATPGPVFSVEAPAGSLTSTSASVSGGNAAATTKTAANGSQTSSSDSSGIFQTVSLARPAGLPKAALAAAVIVPILVVGALVGIYIKFARSKEREKRKRWSEHMDRRMSGVSVDWRAGAPSATGAAGPRASMASTGTRAGSVYFSNGGPRGSTYSVGAGETNMAGAGAGGARIPRVGQNGQHGNNNPEMRQSQLRQSIFNASSPDNVNRQSRISFADDVRKSRVSFGDALRPTQSNLSGLNGQGHGHSRGQSVHSNGASRKSAFNPDRNTTTGSPSGERHSIDNSRLASARFSRKLDREDEQFAISPSQAQGPFALPTHAQPGAAAPVEKKAGLFSALTSAVGLKDKKAGNKQSQEQEEHDRSMDWEQAEATRKSGEAMRNMEATLSEWQIDRFDGR